MSGNNGIKYFSKDISEIPYEILKKGLCWLRPIIIQFGYVNCNNQIDLVWFHNNEYRAQRLSFKEVDAQARRDWPARDQLAWSRLGFGGPWSVALR